MKFHCLLCEMSEHPTVEELDATIKVMRWIWQHVEPSSEHEGMVERLMSIMEVVRLEVVAMHDD